MIWTKDNTGVVRTMARHNARTPELQSTLLTHLAGTSDHLSK